MKSYIKTTLFLTLLCCTFIASINWLINPFLMFSTPIFHQVNEFATECYYKQMVFKPYQLRSIKPRSIIIGTSHAGIAFNPDDLPQPAYNLAIGGASSYINLRLLQEAISSNKNLKNIILETAFFGFNSEDPNNSPKQDPQFEGRLTYTDNLKFNPAFIGYFISDKLSSILSWESLRASLRMLSKQHDVGNKSRGSFIEKHNGQWIQHPPTNTPTWKLFEQSWKKFLYEEWFPAPNRTFTFTPSDAPINYYRQSLKLLYAHDINTNIVIAPLHGSLLIALHEVGLWPDFEIWKATLVRVNEEEAASAGKKPFVLWDYGTINPYTEQALPEQHNSTERLSWFNDSAHASPLLGGIILQELGGATAPIGTQLRNSNIAQHLQQSSARLKNYQMQNQELHVKIQQLIQDAPKNIHFPSHQ